MSVQEALRYLESHRNEFVEQLFDLLRIPSISTLPEHQADMARAAEWCRRLLEAMGISGRVVPTAHHPAVLGRYEADPAAPTLMIYGHYDVQPAGDESLWSSPPFEPVVRDGAVYARGAADNKGQMLTALFALECWLKGASSLPTNVVVFIEGEEEIGSPSFAGFLDAHADELTCQAVLVVDSSQFRPGRPGITYATRGLVYKEIELTGPSHDLHSGVYGGVAPNPANILCEILAAMIDDAGRVRLPGFYDDVRPLTDRERALLAALPFDEAATCRQLGVDRLVGEPDYSPAERIWARPTLDVNGMLSGFTGPGAATIIPAKASAKVSMRLVPDQDPAAISAAFDRFVEDHLRGRCRLRIREHAGCRAYLAPLDSPAIQAARQAVKAAWGCEPDLGRAGGTLPILPMLKDRLGADSILLGYCQPDCPVHGPNELLGLDDFEAGIRTAIHLLERFGRLVRWAGRRE